MPEEPPSHPAQASRQGIVVSSTRLSSETGLSRVAPYYALDAWRGLAAFWVVMLHSCLPYIISGHRSFLRNPVYMVSIWGQLGVTIFFVISGYCITGAAYSSIAARKPLIRFCADRARRIYPPYLAALCLAAALLMVTAFLQWHHLLPAYGSPPEPLALRYLFWLTNLTLTQLPAGQASLLVVAWSLCYEVAFYAVIACFLGVGLLLGTRDPLRRVALLLAGVGMMTCGSLIWLCVSPATCPFPLDLWYQFGFGSLLFLRFALHARSPGTFVHSLRQSTRMTITGVFVFSMAFLVLPRQYHGIWSGTLGHPSMRVQCVAAMLFCAILYLLRPHDARLLRNAPIRAFTRIGAFSYSLYLVHLPLLPYVDKGFRRLGFTGDGYLLTYVTQIVVSVTAGWLFFLLVERRFISGRQVHRLAAE